MRVALGLFVVLATVVTAGCETEQSAWEDAQQERTPEAVQAFLTNYDGGEYAQDAVLLMNMLLAEQAAWETALVSNSDRDLRRFLENFPESMHQAEAAEMLQAAVAALLADFTADAMLVFFSAEGDGYVTAPGLANNPLPLAMWQGRLAFSLGGPNGFTGVPTFQVPDPVSQNVVIAVLADGLLIPELERGQAYVWRGGRNMIPVRDIEGLSVDEVSAAFGFEPGQGYMNFPPRELLDIP